MSGGLAGETRERFTSCERCKGRGWHWDHDEKDEPIADLGVFREVYCSCDAGVLLRSIDGESPDKSEDEKRDDDG